VSLRSGWPLVGALLLGCATTDVRVLGPRLEECADCAACADCTAGVACVPFEGLRVHSRRGLRAVSAYERDPDEAPPTERELLDAVEDEPERAGRWWALGDYYESQRRYADALAAYEELQARIERGAHATGKRYTGGLFLIGKMHARLGDAAEAARYMHAVLEHEPDQPTAASRNGNFREAHFTLGWLYLRHGQLDLAERHLEAFRTLTPGSFRADGLLIEVADARRRRAALEGALVSNHGAAAPAESASPRDE